MQIITKRRIMRLTITKKLNLILFVFGRAKTFHVEIAAELQTELTKYA